MHNSRFCSIIFLTEQHTPALLLKKLPGELLMEEFLPKIREFIPPGTRWALFNHRGERLFSELTLSLIHI